jgi:acetyl-CoA C-acetyltransferase
MSNIKGKAAFIGIGEVPTGRFPETAAIYHAIESARLAIKDAGIDKDDIDFVMPTASLYSPAFNTELVTCRIVEELGLKNCKKNCQVFAGGSSSSCGLQLAESMIAGGVANTILFVHADRLGTGVTAQGGIDLFSTAGISAEWEVPFGQHYSTIASLTTTRYKYETGCTDEELSAVCVSNRKWAELNPNAFFNKKSLTIEEVMSSKMLSTPLRAKQSNMLFDGGAAFLLTSTERAKDITDTPVYVLGEGGIVTHFVYSQEPDVTRFGWARAGKEAFQEAGLTPADIDVAEIYDSYPVFQIIGLEELGFCERGEAGKMYLDGDTWPGGKLPCTTNGGMLSQGHTGAGGAVALMVEAVRQLMGKAGERQVKDAKFAVETATGGTYMDAQVTILGTKIP